MPVRGGPHAELAIRFADAIATYHGATVVVLHLVPPGITMAVRAQAERALATFIKQHLKGKGEAVLREAPNVRNAILREAEKADLVVMGASAAPGGDGADSYLFGALPEAIAARAKPTVVVVKTREAIGRTTFDALAARPRPWPPPTGQPRRPAPSRPASSAGSANRTSTTPSSATCVASSSSRRSRASRSRLVLPTLDEEETIGPIVRRAMREMVGRVPLLDEVLVIDSASTDRTREIAEAEGARVVQHPDVLARYGSFRGKGEALWKSLYETTGDIVVWADTDVKNWHHRMVYGTLGPLLHEPRLQYVKGYYQRPIVEDGVLKEGGGGRVTELVARPLINLFYPELSGLIQPLAGEYAGRRSLLESIPFFTGYAVEIGHLIDAAERVGIEGLGQVDLERRVHRNQELEGLSRMSFVILQAVMKRLEERRKARLFAELGSTMKLPRSGKGRLSLEVIELADQERPPMIRIPEYLERRRAAGARTRTDHPVTERALRSASSTRRYAAIPDLAALLVDAVDSGAGVNFLAGVTADERPPGGWRGATRCATASSRRSSRATTTASSAPRCSSDSSNRQSAASSEIGKVLAQLGPAAGPRDGADGRGEDRAGPTVAGCSSSTPSPGARRTPSTGRWAGTRSGSCRTSRCCRTGRRRRRRSSGRTSGDAGRTVLIAPDSFKGSLTSVEVARALADGWRRARPDDEILLCPLADGGEGTLAAIEAAGGWQRRTSTVRDPLGRPIEARWLRLGRRTRARSSRWPRPPGCRG